MTPTAITLHGASRVLEIAFDDGLAARIPYELLRVLSPSAEVQGHGPGQGTVQTGKRGVTITALEPVGHYGCKPTFSDGHDTGIYTWAYLHDLGRDLDAAWARYQAELDATGAERDAPMAGRRAGGCS